MVSVSATPFLSLYSATEDGSVECVDLTHPLSEATPIIELPEPYANTPGWSLEEVSNYDERGPLFYWSSFRLREVVKSNRRRVTVGEAAELVRRLVKRPARLQPSWSTVPRHASVPPSIGIETPLM